MRVLAVGDDPSAHAVVSTLAGSSRATEVLCCPGSAATAGLGANVDAAPDDIDGLIGVAKERHADLALALAAEPLAAGLADRFAAVGLRCLGPSQANAQLETDKAFARQIMREAATPCAEARLFDLAKPARLYAASRDSAVVVRPTAMTDGRGTFICEDPADGILAVENLMQEEAFGAAGQRVLVEERLLGTEVVVPALIDGRTIYVLEPVQVYRRPHDGDDGPITPGMGAVCPAPSASDRVMTEIERDILLPIVDVLTRAGMPYCGVLCAECIVTAGGPKLCGVAVRLKACVADALLPRLRADWLEALDACQRGKLDTVRLEWDPRVAVNVVLAADEGSAGPSDASTIAAQPDVFVWNHATAARSGALSVTALGDGVSSARHKAYGAVERMAIENVHYRKDIAAGGADER
jgi:phosphoribosylamine--glycine ligase